LRLDRILGGAEEGLDTKMLFDLFEEQLDLPTLPIKFGDGQGRQREVVGQKHQPLVGYGVAVLDSPQGRIELLARVKPGEHDGLVAQR
jgi:hypothetical protein